VIQSRSAINVQGQFVKECRSALPTLLINVKVHNSKPVYTAFVG